MKLNFQASPSPFETKEKQEKHIYNRKNKSWKAL